MHFDLSVAIKRLESLWISGVEMIPNLMIAILIFAIFYFVSGLVDRGVKGLVHRAHQPQSAAIVLGRVAGWSVLMLGSLVATTIVVPSLNANSLFSALGVGSVAVGFAFKDVFQNLLAGILILITHPFHIGDQIVSGEHEGTVEDVQIRATKLRTYDNRLVVIPNSELYTGRVVVNTANENRRIGVQIGIGNGDDIKEAKKVILETIKDIDGILDTPAPEVIITGFGDFSVNLEVRAWVDPPRKRETVATMDAMYEAIKEALTNAGIDLPYPTSQVLFHDQTEETDGDRKLQREGWVSGKNNPRSRQSLLREQRDRIANQRRQNDSEEAMAIKTQTDQGHRVQKSQDGRAPA